MSSGLIAPDDQTRWKSSVRSNMMSKDRRVAPLLVPRIELAMSRSRSISLSPIRSGQAPSHVDDLDVEDVLPLRPGVHLDDVPDTPVVDRSHREGAHREGLAGVVVVELAGELGVPGQGLVPRCRLVRSRLRLADRVDQDPELVALGLGDWFVLAHDPVLAVHAEADGVLVRFDA